jgi:hypothetical protein
VKVETLLDDALLRLLAANFHDPHPTVRTERRCIRRSLKVDVPAG